MTSERYPSQVFTLRREFYAKLRGAPWPPYADLPAPTIGSGPSPDGALPFEQVYLERVSSDLSVAALGNVLREEAIRASVVIESEIPGLDEDQACTRAEKLAGVVEELIFDTSLQQPVVQYLSGEVLSALVTGMQFWPYPSTEGHGCRVEIEFEVSADI